MAQIRMSDYHKVFDDGFGFRIGIRNRFESKKMVKYRISYDDANLIPGHTLEVVARKLFGDDDLWWVIADLNPLKHPSEWQMDDEILLPLDENIVRVQRNRNKFGR